jgi:hypothetical protein
MSRLFRETGGTNSFDVRNENGRMRFGKRFGDEKI